MTKILFLITVKIDLASLPSFVLLDESSRGVCGIDERPRGWALRVSGQISWLHGVEPKYWWALKVVLTYDFWVTFHGCFPFIGQGEEMNDPNQNFYCLCQRGRKSLGRCHGDVWTHIEVGSDWHPSLEMSIYHLSPPCTPHEACRTQLHVSLNALKRAFEPNVLAHRNARARVIKPETCF